MQEEKISTSSHFITLTYDTKHVNITDRGFMSLKKRDLQLFFKRLRKGHGEISKIKYYAVGEYGGRSNRPHYHIILFNANIDKINSAWLLGNVHYGAVSGASVGYTLKYMSKPKRFPLHKNDDRVQEFSLMSKGLGKNYLSPKMIKYHKDDLNSRMYLNLKDGKKCSMPRYYKDKLYTTMERATIAKAAIISRSEQLQEDVSRRGVKIFEDYQKEKTRVDHAIKNNYPDKSKTVI